MNPFPLAALALAGLILVGCDAAEESAQNLTEKAGKAAQELAREAVSETVDSLNRQIDKAQESSKEWLGKPEDKQADERKPEPQHSEGVET